MKNINKKVCFSFEIYFCFSQIWFHELIVNNLIYSINRNRFMIVSIVKSYTIPSLIEIVQSMS